MIFFKLILIFLTLSSKEILLDKCIEWNGIYNIGDKYVHEGRDVCKICICSNDWVNPCNRTNKCDQLNCQQNYTYELQCCQRLGCLGIF